MFGQPEHAGASDAVVVWRVRPNPEVIVHVADSADRFRDIFGSAFGTTAELASSLWNLRSGKRWMIPLVLFLCLTGLILTLAATVEALAPFVYSIF